MNAFESSLLHGIPLHEAAGFFHRIKKAGWGDPPDETGALEGQFGAPIEQVIQQLTEVIAAKFKLMVAYHIYSQSMRGVAQHGVAEVFIEHAEQERAAAEAYLKRAAVLGGGPVHLPEIETPPASADPVGILMLMARAEQEGIATQHQLKLMVGEDNPLSFQIEQYMIEDQHHLDELWQMLPADAVRTPVIDTQAAGAAPELPAEPPPEEEAPAEAPKAEAKPVPKTAGALATLESAGKRVADDAAGAARGAAGEGPAARPWAGFYKKFKLPTSSGAELAGLSAAGGLAGAALGSGAQALQDPEHRQMAAEDAGPIGRMSQRHPALSGAAMGALGGAGIGLGGNKILRSLAAGDTQTAAGLKGLPYVAGGLAAPYTAMAVDSHLHQRELEDLAKNGSAIANVGKKLKKGLQRYGQLLEGGRAAEYAGKSAKHLEAAQVVGIAGLDHAAEFKANPEAAKRIARKFQHEMKSSRRIGDLSNKEHALSMKVQTGTGLGVGGGILAASHGKNKHDQEKVDRVNARLKRAFVEGLQKLGFSPPEPGMGNDPGAAPSPDSQPTVAPVASMEQPGEQPPMATPPGQQTYAPMNYLEAEETARRAQASNEAEFYRNQAQTATSQVQSMGQQAQAIQGQLDQLTQQASESQSQIMAANQEAVQANDQMLNQATLAARMRMGMQQLRAQMMEIASQDPEQLAAAAGGPTPMDVGNQAQAGAAPPGGDPGLNGETQVTGDPSGAAGAPGAQPGTTDNAASAGAPPGSPPGGAGAPDTDTSAPAEPQNAGGAPDKKEGGETTVSIKKAAGTGNLLQEMRSSLPYAAAGAGVGAIGGAIEKGLEARNGKAIPSLRQKVDELKGQQSEGGFGKSIDLAQAQLSLGKAEEARAHPGRAALRGGLAGAGIGAGAGMAVPSLISGGKQLMKNIATARNP